MAEHRFSIGAWKILFVVTGLATAALGVLFYFFMPDNQLNARFLSPHERFLAIERVCINSQGIGNKYLKWYQFREALTDPAVWAMTLFSLLQNIPNDGLTNFLSQMTVKSGFTEQQTLHTAYREAPLKSFQPTVWPFG